MTARSRAPGGIKQQREQLAGQITAMDVGIERITIGAVGPPKTGSDAADQNSPPPAASQGSFAHLADSQSRRVFPNAFPPLPALAPEWRVAPGQVVLKFPVLEMGLFILVLFGMELILSVWTIRRQKKQSLIEQMRAME